MSQTDRILAALRQGRTITPLEALDTFGCFRLAARIADAKLLLGPGEEIVTETQHTPTGKSIARYRLVVTKPTQTELW